MNDSPYAGEHRALSVAQSGRTGSPGYTRSMVWRQRIAFVLLLALAGLPAGGMLCAVACHATSQAAPHHGADERCDEPVRSSSGSRIGNDAAHDCRTHDQSVGQVATTAAERGDLSARSAPTLVDSSNGRSVVASHDVFDYTSPPGTAPPTVRPIVLRV